MELSQRFLDTLTPSQREMLDEDQALSSKQALQAYLQQQAEKDKAEAEFAEAIKAHFV